MTSHTSTSEPDADADDLPEQAEAASRADAPIETPAGADAQPDVPAAAEATRDAPAEVDASRVLTEELDRLSLEQALTDFGLANARVLDLTRRLTELSQEVARLSDENARLRSAPARGARGLVGLPDAPGRPRLGERRPEGADPRPEALTVTRVLMAITVYNGREFLPRSSRRPPRPVTRPRPTSTSSSSTTAAPSPASATTCRPGPTRPACSATARPATSASCAT